MSIHNILAEFRDAALNNRDLGDKFERLICRYLQLDPQYAERFSNVWLWNEWPLKGDSGDIGIDIVAEEDATGDIVGIQCKFYLPEHQLSKGDIDSFLSALGKRQFSSGIIVSTTDKWGSNVEHTIKDQSKPIQKLRVQDLDASPVDWSTFSLEAINRLKLQKKRDPRPHQRAAIADVKACFADHDRGKLIMACGTGKTYTSLAITEEIALGGTVLFLVPSLALLAQTLREWTAFSSKPIHALAVCSDSSIGRRKTKDADDVDIDVTDLAFPATTNTKALIHQWEALQSKIKKRKQSKENRGTAVVFSTYHSIASVHEAQKKGLPDFDLVVCDEAHRTTGVTLADQDESHFIKIHDNDYIRASKRLYMTATPRVYGDETKSKADDADATLCSMDDEAVYGPEFHRLGFGEAVEKNLLTDYKVLVLAVDEAYASKTFQAQIADSDNSLTLDDAVRITGCWNGLAKKLDHTTTDEAELYGDLAPMRTAVAFSRSIADSKAFCSYFGELVDSYKGDHPDEENLLDVQVDHVDGSMNAITRAHKLDWLKEPGPALRCRILSNARCLSEGIDVPSLDAVIFLNPRNSVVDVVQSVGRVMRKATDKQYGYIILPIGIPAGITPEEALKDNKKYAIVWQVLQALRSHDDRFNATINQIELNKKAPPKIGVIGIGEGGGVSDDTGSKSDGDSTDKKSNGSQQYTFNFSHQLQEWKDALYARIVKKCGERRYWHKWAEDVAKIAQRHTDRIQLLLDQGGPKHVKAFDQFLSGLHQNINPAITSEEAVEMLSQHLISKPIFDALFADYAFSDLNPVSQSMQKMLDALEGQALEKETASLEKFYASVRTRVAGIDNAEGKQKIILELYEKFFATAFKSVAERLGIVYTPTEVVDFIIRSVEDVLQSEFNSSLSAKDVHIIDPFTGTGTFITRLLQSGLIRPEDIQRKFTNELHANEIVLLAYYIAAINIEETFHTLQQEAGANDDDSHKSADRLEYVPFDGIVLTDTFNLTEVSETQTEMQDVMFPVNNMRVTRQKNAPIRVILANPPYSVNDNPVAYPTLDTRITETYAARSAAINKNSLYDSYIRAIRWASDRIGKQGVIGFVTNGQFIDSNVGSGLRACLVDEFTSLYIVNLRGNARTSGEQRRKEKDNVFGQGSRTPIAISILVRNPLKRGPGELFYHDIGDYLTRQEKLSTIARLVSINALNRENKWCRIRPNSSHDWINHRDPAFQRFIPMNSDHHGQLEFFADRQNGVQTNRDAWVYNFSRHKLATTMQTSIDFFNQQVDAHGAACRAASDPPAEAKRRVIEDDKRIKWTSSLIAKLCQSRKTTFSEAKIGISLYRPYSKSALYYDKHFNHRYKERIYPTINHQNLMIMWQVRWSGSGIGALAVGNLPDLHPDGGVQCFPLYLYEKVQAIAGRLDLDTEDDDVVIIDGYRRRNAITDGIHAKFRLVYGDKVEKEDIFYYVYGILHSPEYRERFAADLQKMLPRIPLTKELADYQCFTQAGRDLANMHLNYETVDPHPNISEQCDELCIDPWELFKLQKMTFARPSPKQKAQGLKWDKTRIVYNSKVTLSGIPLDAYDYVVNGKPALEWIMERYQITVDKNSGIKNDPNDWCREHDNPRYIIDLVKRITRVSVETNHIVANLPALNERT
ncbi:type ISP restriction/modification enzyme [Synechococcus sp. BO 8801]|uniref:DEAD/DEAH box helicase n=1 Tax=Synechococcus sp. BO 8801 TaxID=169670 RepID=UPI000B999B36|nr:type ISP restriction/modification enzyme [Synechococcus sp. BO 8801]